MDPKPAPGSLEITLKELYQIIGELEVMRRKQQDLLAAAPKPVDGPHVSEWPKPAREA